MIVLAKPRDNEGDFAIMGPRVVCICKTDGVWVVGEGKVAPKHEKHE